MTATENRRQACLDGENVRRNASGNPVKSVQETISAAARILRAIPKRVALGEVNEPDLAALNELHAVIDTAIAETVRQMRAELDDYGKPTTSWSQIGRALGVSKQAAQQRFG